MSIQLSPPPFRLFIYHLLPSSWPMSSTSQSSSSLYGSSADPLYKHKPTSGPDVFVSHSLSPFPSPSPPSQSFHCTIILTKQSQHSLTLLSTMSPLDASSSGYLTRFVQWPLAISESWPQDSTASAMQTLRSIVSLKGYVDLRFSKDWCWCSYI